MKIAFPIDEQPETIAIGAFLNKIDNKFKNKKDIIPEQILQDVETETMGYSYEPLVRTPIPENQRTKKRK